MKSIFKITMITAFIMFLGSCSDDESCGYDVTTTNPPIVTPLPPGCELGEELNLSTGIDLNGNVLPTPTTNADAVIDPYWKLLNRPLVTSCNFVADGNAYTSTIGTSGPDDWVNQTGAVSLSPFNAGDSSPGNCANPDNADGVNIPYVFDRSFCVLEDATADLNFTFKGDNVLYFELVNNSVPAVLDVSSTYTFGGPPNSWNTTGITLTAGSYSIRAYLVNNESFLGFSLLGNIMTASGDEVFSNNADGCCENNIISILNLVEQAADCDGIFNTGDQVTGGWDFVLKDGTNTTVATGTSDTNGNLFFAGLNDGTYTVEITPMPGFTSSGPVTVTVANDQVQILDFFNCID